jgi:hypothetical protein
VLPRRKKPCPSRTASPSCPECKPIDIP